MAEVPHAAPVEEQLPDFGSYQQELKRTLGPAQVFAISFAFISVAVGIFGTFDDVLRTAGPVGIWLWVIAAVGQTLVLGGWYHTSKRFADQRYATDGLSLADLVSTGIPRDHRGNWGIYGMVDAALYRTAGGAGRGIGRAQNIGISGLHIGNWLRRQ
jgi:hypothetical protein